MILVFPVAPLLSVYAIARRLPGLQPGARRGRIVRHDNKLLRLLVAVDVIFPVLVVVTALR